MLFFNLFFFLNGVPHELNDRCQWILIRVAVQLYVSLGNFFFAEVLNLNKFLCIVLIFLRILGDFK